jgi:hypothetical protein
MPPAGILAHVLVVRGIDEDPDRHAPAIVFQVVADYLADRDAAVKDRRAGIDRTERVAVQGVMRAFLVARHLRHFFQAREGVAVFLRFAGIDPDVGAGQQGAQAGYAAYANARLDHPEPGVGCREAARVLVHIDGDQYLAQVRRQRD